MIRRPCLDCGQLTTSTRCPTHDRNHKAKRNSHTTAARTLVTQWLTTYGPTCPGWQRDPHPSHDLTADHSTPISKGGLPDQVLCRSCNARKSDRTAHFSEPTPPKDKPVSLSAVTHRGGDS